MKNRALIKLVQASKQHTITLQELKDIFIYYKTITAKTGDQLDWQYGDAAFPYEIKELPGNEDTHFYLKSSVDRYNYIVFGIIQDETETMIEVILPEGATHGDKGKANEFCKFLGKKLEGELHLFNGRIMYFYKRK